MFLSQGAARELAAAVAPALPAASRGRVPVANYHVTLKFLGATPASRLPGVLDRVAGLDAHPVTVRVTGVTGFPGPGRARVLVATLAPEPQLAAWHDALTVLADRDDRAFRPHVTLQRLGRPRRVASFGLQEPLTVELQAPRLYRSDSTRQGVRYRPVDG